MFAFPPTGAHMIVCAICGNKRCPHATSHENACTRSNAPGQKGSSWEDYKTLEKVSQTNEQPRPDEWINVSTLPPEGVEVWVADCVNPMCKATWSGGAWHRQDEHKRPIYLWTHIKPLRQTNERPQGVTPGEAVAKAWLTTTFCDPTNAYFDGLAQAAISAYLAALPADGPSDEEIWQSITCIKAKTASSFDSMRELFAKHYAAKITTIANDNATERAIWEKQVGEAQRQVQAADLLYRSMCEERDALKARIEELEAVIEEEGLKA